MNDRSKLPKWAQRDFEVLERNLAAVKADLARQRPTVEDHLQLTGHEPFTLHGASTGHLYVPFDKDVTASWLLNDERPGRPDRIDVYLERRPGVGQAARLTVRTDGGSLDIRPHVSNVVTLGVTDR